MSEPWPPAIMKSFSVANHSSRGDDQSVLHGTYNRLLWHLFRGPLGPYEVIPPWREQSGIDIDTASQSPFTIEMNEHPVFFVDVQPAADIKVHSARAQADARMRAYLRDFHPETVIPYLHGVSAFGSRLRFYKCTRATGRLEPAHIPADPVVLNDLAPAAQWDCDLLEADGAARFREVVESVLQMCQAPEQK